MPRGDGTGPIGRGSMSERRAGYCAGYPMPGFSNHTWGRGVGGGMGGGGHGHRHWYHATGMMGWQRDGMGWPREPAFHGIGPVDEWSEESELKALERHATELERSLVKIRERIQRVQQSVPTEE